MKVFKFVLIRKFFYLTFKPISLNLWLLQFRFSVKVPDTFVCKNQCIVSELYYAIIPIVGPKHQVNSSNSCMRFQKTRIDIPN